MKYLSTMNILVVVLFLGAALEAGRTGLAIRTVASDLVVKPLVPSWSFTYSLKGLHAIEEMTPIPRGCLADGSTESYHDLFGGNPTFIREKMNVTSSTSSSEGPTTIQNENILLFLHNKSKLENQSSVWNLDREITIDIPLGFSPTCAPRNNIIKGGPASKAAFVGITAPDSSGKRSLANQIPGQNSSVVLSSSLKFPPGTLFASRLGPDCSIVVVESPPTESSSTSGDRKYSKETIAAYNSTGSLLWRSPIPAADRVLGCTPSAVDVTSTIAYVLLSAGAGYVAAYNITNGDFLWLSDYYGGTHFPHLMVAGDCNSTLVSPETAVFAGDNNNKMVAFDARSGNITWKTRWDGATRKVYRTLEGPVGLGEDVGQIAQFNGTSGQLLWASYNSGGDYYVGGPPQAMTPCGSAFCTVAGYLNKTDHEFRTGLLVQQGIPSSSSSSSARSILRLAPLSAFNSVIAFAGFPDAVALYTLGSENATLSYYHW